MLCHNLQRTTPGNTGSLLEFEVPARNAGIPGILLLLQEITTRASRFIFSPITAKLATAV